jgi:signal transduction histidine kinase
METSTTSIALRSIGCHRCAAEAGVRLGKEFLCGACAIEDLRSDPAPVVVLCDICERDSTLRLDERFLCGRCALTLLCVDAEEESDLLRGAASALASAVVGQREPAIAWAWELAKRTRDGVVTVVEASATHHRALVELTRAAAVDDGPVPTARIVEAGASVFGTYASSLDGHLRGLTDERNELGAQVRALTRTVDDLRHERDELIHRLGRAEQGRSAIVRHITSAKEEERARIAEEIHDDTLQTLVALQMRLQALGGGPGGAAADALGELGRATAGSIRRLRTLMFELRSDLLDQYGLTGVLRELFARTEEEFGVRITLDDGLGTEPPPDAGINLYRIAQEAITNVRKHARTSAAEVRLEEQDGGVLLTVADDGVGFDIHREPPADHGGVRFMRDRAERAGGRVEIVSAPGTGTSIRCWIPTGIGGVR